MRSGIIEASPTPLNEEFGLPYISELIAPKMESHERSALDEPDVEFFRREYERPIAMLEEASAASLLPEGQSSRAALNDLLIRCPWEIDRSHYRCPDGGPHGHAPCGSR